jgi:hypothetical protein
LNLLFRGGAQRCLRRFNRRRPTQRGEKLPLAAKDLAAKGLAHSKRWDGTAGWNSRAESTFHAFFTIRASISKVQENVFQLERRCFWASSESEAAPEAADAGVVEMVDSPKKVWIKNNL